MARPEAGLSLSALKLPPVDTSSVVARPLEAVSLRAFLARASSYERWPAPLDARLRRTTRASGGVMVLVSLVLLAAHPFVPLKPDPLMLLNAFGLCLYAILGITGGMRDGRAWRHWLAFAVAAIGSLNGLAIAVPLALGALWVVGLMVFFVVRLAASLLSGTIVLGAFVGLTPFLALGGTIGGLSGSIALVVRLRAAFARRGGTAAKSDKMSGR